MIKLIRRSNILLFFIFIVMNLQENIRRILREETQIPIPIRRRLKFGVSILDDMKANSLRYAGNRTISEVIEKSAYFTADNMVKYDEALEEYDWETYEKIIDTMVSLVS